MENADDLPGEVAEEAVESVESTGTLSEILKDKVDTNYFKVHTIMLTIKDGIAPDVTMEGFWDGNLLKAAMRAIERKYNDVRKVSSVAAMRAVQEKAATLEK